MQPLLLTVPAALAAAGSSMLQQQHNTDISTTVAYTCNMVAYSSDNPAKTQAQTALAC